MNKGGSALLKFISCSTLQTENFAFTLAKKLLPKDILACRGGMGVGKTAFARGLAAGLALTDPVSSPTFALVHEYTHGNIPLYHFDMYRVENLDSLYSTGFFDYLGQNGILLIEWSENILEALPENIITISFNRVDDDTREITVEGGTF